MKGNQEATDTPIEKLIRGVEPGAIRPIPKGGRSIAWAVGMRPVGRFSGSWDPCRPRFARNCHVNGSNYLKSKSQSFTRLSRSKLKSCVRSKQELGTTAAVPHQ